jgi:hypothetical protein
MNHTLVLKGGSLTLDGLLISNDSSRPVVVSEIGTVLTIHHDTSYMTKVERPRNFGWALKHIKDGGRAQRQAWQGCSVGEAELDELSREDLMADDWVEAL